MGSAANALDDGHAGSYGGAVPWRRSSMSDFDNPWKDVLEHFFRPFLAFFFPEAHAAIDWDRNYESLDTELQQIVSESELGLPCRQALQGLAQGRAGSVDPHPRRNPKPARSRVRRADVCL